MTTSVIVWCGAPTANSLRPIFVLSGAAVNVRGVFSVHPDMSVPIYTAMVSPDANHVCKPGDVTGLAGDTRYYYCAEIDGVLDLANIARARTLPPDGATVKITFGSCWAGTGQSGATTPNHAVGAAAAAQHDAGAHLHIFDGDMGYLDGKTGISTCYTDNFIMLHGLSNFKALARAGCWDAVWDDHDFGGNNTNGTYSRKADAAAAWRQYVPLPDLPVGDAIYHAYNLTSQIRVVVSDLRYFRAVDTAIDDATKSMLGSAQKAWLKSEWLAAKNAGQLIIWVTSSMWGIDGADATSGLNTDDDGWWAFTTERAELDNYRSANDITDMIILTGDGHQISYRTGIDYSSAHDVPVPMFAAAAYARSAAYRPGAWNATSDPTDPEGHYAVLSVAKIAGNWSIDCDFHKVNSVDSANDVVQFSAHVGFGSTPVVAGKYVVKDATGKLFAVTSAGHANSVGV